MKKLSVGSNGVAAVVPARGAGVHGWQRWAPYAAVAWSLVYAALGIYWAVSGLGFPYVSETLPAGIAPLLGQFGPGPDWVVVILAGIPAAVMGMAMLRDVRGKFFRPFLITSGTVLAAVLLLLMTGLNLLVSLGYIPLGVFSLITGAAFGQAFLEEVFQWAVAHQLLCLTGGFLWLAATVCYARRSGDACLYCGRGNNMEGWTSPDSVARWGKVAVYVSMAAPILYAIPRYAWMLGYPLGMSAADFIRDQERGIFISGLFLATFGLVGAILTLGLVQRWGEIFPRWMIGLAGRRVPIALAVVPASLVSVLLIVGGIGIWSGLGPMVAVLEAEGAKGFQLIEEIFFQVGSTLLFPLWGATLAAATLAYYYRRRGPCSVCGHGASTEIGDHHHSLRSAHSPAAKED